MSALTRERVQELLTACGHLSQVAGIRAEVERDLLATLNGWLATWDAHEPVRPLAGLPLCEACREWLAQQGQCSVRRTLTGGKP